MMEKVTDEMLMAFVDGELALADADEIARIARIDPAVAGRIAMFERSRAAVAGAFAPIVHEPVPERLVQAVTAMPATPRPVNDNRAWYRNWPAMGAIAASVAVLAGLAGYFAGRDGGAGDSATFLAAATSAPVIAALAATPSGEPVTVLALGRAVQAVAVGTYPTDAGPCRIFEASGGGETARAVTCLGSDGWQVPLAIEGGEAGDYQTASDAATAAIDALLDGLGAGGALDIESEQALIAAGWQR